MTDAYPIYTLDVEELAGIHESCARELAKIGITDDQNIQNVYRWVVNHYERQRLGGVN